MTQQRAHRAEQGRGRGYRLAAVLLLAALAIVAVWAFNRANHSDGSERVTGADIARAATTASSSPEDGKATEPANPRTSSPTTDPAPDPDEKRTTGPNKAATKPKSDAPKPVKAKIDQTATLTEDVTVKVSRADVVNVEGKGPGELSGPAWRIRLELANGATVPFDLSTVVVSLEAADGTPLSPIETAAQAQPLRGELGAGSTAGGDYLFLAPDAAQQKVRLEFSTSTNEPIVVFTGPLKTSPRATPGSGDDQE